MLRRMKLRRLKNIFPIEVDEEVVEEAAIFTVVESMPEFKGGVERALYSILAIILSIL